MAQKRHGPLHGVSGPGLGDYSRAAIKSGPSLPLIHQLRQAAALQLRRQRLVERLHRLGARATYEFVDELARHHPQIADDIDERLERYAALDPALLRAVGGERFPSSPLRVVRGVP